MDRLTAGLLQAAGIQRAGQAVRMSDSPEAMRLYIEGVSWFRRSRYVEAAVAFERAVALDPQFARAAYMRWMAATWGPGFGTSAQTLWRERTIPAVGLMRDEALAAFAAWQAKLDRVPY